MGATYNTAIGFLVAFLLTLHPCLLSARQEANVTLTDTARLDILIMKGKSLLYMNPDSALEYANEAERLAAKMDWKLRIAETNNLIGAARYIKGEYDLALVHHMVALHLYEQLGDHYGLSTSFNHIGLIQVTQHEYRKAIDNHRKGLAHAMKIKNSDRYIRNLFNIGLVYDELGKPDSAMYYFQQSLQESRQTDNYRMIVMSLNRIGKEYCRTKDYDNAAAIYLSALHFKEYTDNWEKCFSLAGLAEVYGEKGNYDLAIETAHQSIELAKRIGAKWDVVHASDILLKIYEKKYSASASMKDLFATFHTLRSNHDSMYNAERQNKMNFIQLQENQLIQAKLEKENSLQAIELRQMNLKVAVAVAASLVLLLLAFLFYQRQRNKTRLNQELQLINNSIEQRNRQLNELNQTKDELLSIVSHDVRAPINSLSGLLQLINAKMITDEERNELVHKLGHRFTAISNTLDNLLQWASSQRDGLKTTPSLLPVDELIAKTILFCEASVINKNISLHHKKNDFSIYGDRYQVKTAIRNILGNAIKFTPVNGSIYIDTIKKDSRTGIVITDTGIGMPMEIKDKLFSLNRETQRDGTLNEKGTGLGLMISYQLIKRNLGAIEVDSTVGKGSTFTIWLPGQPTT